MIRRLPVHTEYEATVIIPVHPYYTTVLIAQPRLRRVQHVISMLSQHAILRSGLKGEWPTRLIVPDTPESELRTAQVRGMSHRYSVHQVQT